MEVFMFAGHDTTTSTLSFALNFITEDKRVLAKCREEMDQIFGNSDRSPTFEDLKSFRYLEACIKVDSKIRKIFLKIFFEKQLKCNQN